MCAVPKIIYTLQKTMILKDMAGQQRLSCIDNTKNGPTALPGIEILTTIMYKWKDSISSFKHHKLIDIWCGHCYLYVVICLAMSCTFQTPFVHGHCL